jgi:hypothetical protein
MHGAILQTVGTGTFMFLAGMVMASLFFAMIAIKQLRENRIEGLVFAGLSLFFLTGHALLLLFYTGPGEMIDFENSMNFWQWAVLILGPALILLYLLPGAFNFIRLSYAEALLKFFFGVTLLAFLYALGDWWPDDVKALLVIMYTVLWFNIELRTVGEME